MSHGFRHASKWESRRCHGGRARPRGTAGNAGAKRSAATRGLPGLGGVAAWATAGRWPKWIGSNNRSESQPTRRNAGPVTALCRLRTPRGRRKNSGLPVVTRGHGQGVRHFNGGCVRVPRIDVWLTRRIGRHSLKGPGCSASWSWHRCVMGGCPGVGGSARGPSQNSAGRA